MQQNIDIQIYVHCIYSPHPGCNRGKRRFRSGFPILKMKKKLPETNSHFALENRPGPKRKQSYSNHPFSDALAVSFREGNNYNTPGGDEPASWVGREPKIYSIQILSRDVVDPDAPDEHFFKLAVEYSQ